MLLSVLVNTFCAVFWKLPIPSFVELFTLLLKPSQLALMVQAGNSHMETFHCYTERHLKTYHMETTSNPNSVDVVTLSVWRLTLSCRWYTPRLMSSHRNMFGTHPIAILLKSILSWMMVWTLTALMFSSELRSLILILLLFSMRSFNRAIMASLTAVALCRSLSLLLRLPNAFHRSNMVERDRHNAGNCFKSLLKFTVTPTFLAKKFNNYSLVQGKWNTFTRHFSFLQCGSCHGNERSDVLAAWYTSVAIAIIIIGTIYKTNLLETRAQANSFSITTLYYFGEIRKSTFRHFLWIMVYSKKQKECPWIYAHVEAIFWSRTKFWFFDISLSNLMIT